VLACRAQEAEQVIRDCRSVLDAIFGGHLLDAAPGDAYDTHNAGTSLLDILDREVRRYEELPGTDLSISLHVLATDVKKAK
jgi:hypothetical protein